MGKNQTTSQLSTNVWNNIACQVSISTIWVVLLLCAVALGTVFVRTKFSPVVFIPSLIQMTVAFHGSSLSLVVASSGLLLLSLPPRNRLFEFEPATKVIFGVQHVNHDNKQTPGSGELLFGRHTLYMAQMVDHALELIGPDAELMLDMLSELGTQHARYGVKPEYFPAFCRALLATVESMLGREECPKESWGIIFKTLSMDMIRSQVEVLESRQ